MPRSAKSFAAPQVYREEIHRLVPGYVELHRRLPTWIAQARPARILVVGCGPGDELVALADAFPAAHVVGLDPDAQMVAAAADRCARADLSARVTVRRGVVTDAPALEFDAVVSVLVAHLIPDDGARSGFYAGLARATRRGGVVFNAELEDCGEADGLRIHEHLEHGRRHGLGDDRLSLMQTRLRRGFHRITAARRLALHAALVQAAPAQVFRAATVVAELWHPAES